jgi:Protein of unknown function (DUF3991)
MRNQDSELDAFKRVIDLRQFAVSLGYEIDRRESWRGSTVLRRGADKIVVKRNGNGHYVFFSVRDDRDNGTVIDLLQRRQNLSLGAVRQILRPWIGRPAISSQFPKLEPAGPDRMRVEGAYRRMADAQRFAYLEHERCVPAAVLLSPRFAGRMRIDSLGNTVFPHFDAAGLCGYEIKNCGFTGFAAGGQKGLWFVVIAYPDGRPASDLDRERRGRALLCRAVSGCRGPDPLCQFGWQTKLTAKGTGPSDYRETTGRGRNRSGIRRR